VLVTQIEMGKSFTIGNENEKKFYNEKFWGEFDK